MYVHFAKIVPLMHYPETQIIWLSMVRSAITDDFIPRLSNHDDMLQAHFYP